MRVWVIRKLQGTHATENMFLVGSTAKRQPDRLSVARRTYQRDFKGMGQG
jgi:hypothetical protein